jgi:hypothetical protein
MCPGSSEEARKVPDIAQANSADERTTGGLTSPVDDTESEMRCGRAIRESDQPAYGEEARKLRHQEMLDEILDTYSAAWKALADL